MVTRPIPRSAICLLALILAGALCVASVRTDSASEEIAAAPAAAGLDIPALVTAVDTAHLPLLSVHDPI